MKFSDRLTAFDRSGVAKLRLEVIKFYTQFGLAPTLSAYKVSKATLYRWRREFNLHEHRLTALIPQSTRPKRLRQRLVDPQIVTLIKQLRFTYGNLGKDKLKPLVDEFCQEKVLSSVSASTIGRVVIDHHCFYQRSGRMYHNPNQDRSKPKAELKRLRQKHAPKPESLGHLEMDSLVKFVDGLKVYLITAIDVKLKFAFALPYSQLNSRNSLDCFKKLELVYPFPVKSVQTDNGLEFLGEFDIYLKKKHLDHYFTYPRCPRINGVVERFNRTLKEDFLTPNLHLVRLPKLFHDKLIDYLLFFNTKRPHQALGQVSPLGYALKEGYLSQMYWTSTDY